MIDDTVLESFDGFLPPPAEDCWTSANPDLIVDGIGSLADSSDDIATLDGISEDEAAFGDVDDESNSDDDNNSDDETNDDGDEAVADTLAEDDADVLNRLAEWLIDVRAAADDFAESVDAEPTGNYHCDDADEVDAPGLLRLVEEFTALRQDVKLQAKSARGLQDQSESVLAGLNRAIEQFQSVAPRENQAVRDTLKPLLESLTDLDASLERGRTAAEAARSRWTGESTVGWQDVIEATAQSMPFWKRWCLKLVSADLTQSLHIRFSETWSAAQEAQVEGYRMIQNRLRRLFQQQHVERIETVGQLADPNLMTVIDVADHESLPAGTVLAELRPGYLWDGQLLRFAEVRVVRSRNAT